LLFAKIAAANFKPNNYFPTHYKVEQYEFSGNQLADMFRAYINFKKG